MVEVTALEEEAADEPMARKHLQIRLIARASISGIDSVPQNRTLVLKNIENFFEEDGRYTIEVLHQTPFGVDMLGGHPLTLSHFGARGRNPVATPEGRPALMRVVLRWVGAGLSS